MTDQPTAGEVDLAEALRRQAADQVERTIEPIRDIAANYSRQLEDALRPLQDARPYGKAIADLMAARESAIADQSRFGEQALLAVDPAVTAAYATNDAVIRLIDQAVLQAEIGQRQENALERLLDELRTARASNDRIARISIGIAVVSAIAAIVAVAK